MRFIKNKRAQINKMKFETEVTIDTTEIQWITRDYREQFQANKLDNLGGKMDKFLETYYLTKSGKKQKT